jgi:hypothetical protein
LDCQGEEQKRRRDFAEYDPERRHWTLHVGCRGVFGFRNYIAGVLGIERTKLRVLTDGSAAA